MSNLKNVIEQIKEIKQLCEEEYAGDEQLFQDMLEAETNANEVMNWAINKIAEETALQGATKTRIEKLQARQKANVNRTEKLKSIFESLLAMTKQRTFKNEVCTVSIRKTPQKVLILDEEKVPELYKKHTSTINKTAIKKALDEKIEVQGCTLSNGGETISFKF